MNYFKTDILKKEFKHFANKILPAVSECGLCEKYFCKWHEIYLITCNESRDARCSACFMFKSILEILIKSLDNDGLNYFENFVTDFQVVMKTLEDCNKIQYISKRRKRTFYKKN